MSDNKQDSKRHYFEIFHKEAVETTKADSQRNQDICDVLMAANVIPKSDQAKQIAVEYYAYMDCI